MNKFGVASVMVFSVTLLSGASLNKPAPAFSLFNSHKQLRTLSNYRGGVVFINFWASWCAPCRHELPELERLAAEYKGRKVRVLAINVDRDRAAAKGLLTQLGLAASSLEVLWDPQSKTVSAYAIDAMPSSFIVDQRGAIRFSHSGFHPQDPVRWRQEIEILLKDNPSS